MPKITFDLNKTTSDGTGVVYAQITCRPVKRGKNGKTLTLKNGFTVVHDGAPVIAELTNNSDPNFWHISITSDTYDNISGFYIIYKDDFFSNLIEVDPSSIPEDADPDAAWWAMARSTVNSGQVVGDDLILERTDGVKVNAGNVRGMAGKDGADGKDGQDGAPGKDGLPGVDGKDGQDGVPGKDGKDGILYYPLDSRNLDDVTPPGEYYTNVFSAITAANNYPFPGSDSKVKVEAISSTRSMQTATAIVSRRKASRYKGSNGIWSAWVEDIRTADLASRAPAFIMDKPREYTIPLVNASKFGGSSNGTLPRISRNLNSVELTGILRDIPGGGTGSSIVGAMKLPPDAMPLSQSNGGGQRWFAQFATGGRTYLLMISSTGGVNIAQLASDMPANGNVFISATWNVAPASIYSFARICARMFENEDYTRTVTDNGSWINIMAPHGGENEPGTSELAKAIRADLGASFYEWDMLKTNVLGTTSFNVGHEVDGDYKGVKFDDVDAVELVLKSDDCLALHGCWDGTGDDNGNGGNGRPPGAISFIGGDNDKLRLLISARLQAAGFRCWDDISKFPGLTGVSKSQIHNVAKNAGVQIEMSETQRQNFFTADYTVRANRANVTPAFTLYKDTIVQAINDYRAGV